MLLGDYEEAQSKYEKALTIYEHIGEKLGEANTYMHVGSLLMFLGDYEEARLKYEKALHIYQHLGKKLGEANTCKHLGDLAVQTGDYEEARSKYEKALTIYEHIDEKDGEASTLIRLGQWAALTGELGYAEAHLDSAYTLYREIGNLEVLADAHTVRALISLLYHDIAKARYELDCCSSIQNKISAYCKAVQWLVLYADHLKQHGFQEGAAMCLEYAEEFASKTQNQVLQNQVKRQSEM
jgi:tetratricopeptide (TPR) repeat protein